MDISFAKYMIQMFMLIVGVAPVMMAYLNAHTEQPNYRLKFYWLVFWWGLPVYNMAKFVILN